MSKNYLNLFSPLYSGLHTGYREIRANKFRSFVTVFGIIMGVGGITAMMSVYKGFERGFLERAERTGGIDRASVKLREPDSEMEEIAFGRSHRDAYRDLLSLDSLYNGKGDIFPGIKIRLPLHRAGRTSRTEIWAVYPEHLVNHTHYVAKGRYFDRKDIERKSQVMIIGSEVAEDLFTGGEEIIGSTVVLGGSAFRICGILYKQERWDKAGKRNYLREKNDRAYIPFTSAIGRLAPLISDSYYPASFSLPDADSIYKQAERAVPLIRRRHNGIEDFDIELNIEWIERVRDQINSTFLIFIIISSIAMLVSGIGILNIMLASLSERIREIGVRMSMGASREDIIMQFLSESLLLTFTGGFAGVAAGLLFASYAGTIGRDLTPVISPSVVFTGFIFCLFTGLFAGLYPAFKAGKLDPAEALRYE